MAARKIWPSKGRNYLGRKGRSDGVVVSADVLHVNRRKDAVVYRVMHNDRPVRVSLTTRAGFFSGYACDKELDKWPRLIGPRLATKTIIRLCPEAADAFDEPADRPRYVGKVQ